MFPKNMSNPSPVVDPPIDNEIHSDILYFTPFGDRLIFLLIVPTLILLPLDDSKKNLTVALSSTPSYRRPTIPRYLRFHAAFRALAHPFSST